MRTKDIEEHRKHWAAIADQNGWYREPFYVQIWRDKAGYITDSVSFQALTGDIVIRPESHTAGVH